MSSLVNPLGLKDMMFLEKVLATCHRQAIFRAILTVCSLLLVIQEEALAKQCTMKETMYYFGLLYGLKLKFVKERSEFLKQFLDLPTIDQLCGTLRLV